MTAEPTALERFRALVATQPAVADALCAFHDMDAFAARALTIAAAHGLSIPPDVMKTAIRPDPLGIGRWTNSPVMVRDWPARDWLPTGLVMENGAGHVDWMHFGGASLAAPFFEDLVRRALTRPVNRLVTIRMTLADFVAQASEEPAPDGLVFHMSRCGSTLVSQMLAAAPQAAALSEAQPLDAIVQLGRLGNAIPPELHASHLVAMARAFARTYRRDNGRFFIKLDSWHTLALGLFRRAFPETPFVFLYRDPVEVLVSHMRQRGSQMVPALVSPALYGLEDPAGDMDEDYCARVLERICSAVVAGHDEVGIRLVNYRDLPDAVRTAVLPHLGVRVSDRDYAVMREAARNDAKTPHMPFSGDSAQKQRAATQAVRTAAARHLNDVYRRLEYLRRTAAEGPTSPQ